MELMRYFISMINKKKATIMLYTICHDAGALTGITVPNLCNDVQ